MTHRLTETLQTDATATVSDDPLLRRAEDTFRSVVPNAELAHFLRRFAQAGPRLLQSLGHLYGHLPNFSDWFVELCTAIGHAYAQRGRDLLVLDSQREAEPDWFTRPTMIGYSAYVDRFAGDLRGVIGRIPYLRELGVRYLHLLPFLRMRAGDNDGGFAVSDFEQVDPKFGSNEDLAELTRALRAESISLASCFVLNHVADDHAWARAARAGDEDKKQFFHIFTSTEARDRYAPYLDEVFPHAAPGNFTWVDELGWVWTTFYPYQWDLNYANPKVFAAMALTMLRLANRGIEVFRLDSAGYLWKRAGTHCKNQPEAHTILQALRAIADIAAPGILLKAEAIMPTRDLPPYFGTGHAAGHECHLAYQSSLMAAAWAAVAEQSADLLDRVVADTPSLPATTSWATYVRCHDDIGWNVLRREAQANGTDAEHRLAAISRYFAGNVPGSFARGAAFQTDADNGVHGSNGMSAALLGLEAAQNDSERELGLRRLQLMYALALSFGGLPILYTGDELAQRNNYSDDSLHDRSNDGRWLQRPRFDPARYAQRDDPHSEAGAAFAALRELCATRARIAALGAAVPRSVLRSSALSVLAFLRGNDFLAAFNFSERHTRVALTSAHIDLQGVWRNAFDDAAAIQSRNAALHLELEPWSFYWLERTR